MRAPSSLLMLLCTAGLLSAGETWTSTEWQQRSEAWSRANGNSLPHWITPEEAGRLDDIGRTFSETPPPLLPPRSVAEFERMAAVMIRYPFGIPYSLIRDLADHHPLITIVSGSSQENSVRNLYSGQNVNLDNCSFLHAPTQSYWTRDYGPWFVQVDAEIAVVDFPYNRPRPGDDDIPIHLAAAWDLDLYGMDLIHAGGNWMSDGYGNAASSDLVLEENPGLDNEDVAQLVQDYLGVDTYHTIPDPNNTYIDHIDCWGKFLDVDKVLIREVSMSHAQYDEIEAVADYFAQAISGWNRPYEVVRVWTPNDEPYTNSIIVNGHVYVPLTGSSWDDEALETYVQALPGHEISGYTYGNNWYSTDALHCRTKGMADPGLLHLHHIPLPDTVQAGVELPVNVTITACSGAALIADSLALRWRVNEGDWERTPLVSGMDPDEWSGLLPGLPAGSELEYVLQAADESGRFDQAPFMGAADPHRCLVAGLPAPELRISAIGGMVTLEWDPVPGAQSYRVERSEQAWSGFVTVAEDWPSTEWSESQGEGACYRVTCLAP